MTLDLKKLDNEFSITYRKAFYEGLATEGVNVSLLKEQELVIAQTMSKAVLDVGAALAEARKAFPETGNRHSDQLWGEWCQGVLGISQKTAQQYLKIHESFGLQGNSGSPEGKLPCFSVLRELSSAKYTHAQRDGLLAAKGAELTRVDCQLLHAIDDGRASSPQEVVDLMNQIKDGYSGSESRMNSIANTFKAVDAHASVIRSTAQDYDEVREFAPPRVLKKVEDSMTSAIAPWLCSLPASKLLELRDVIDTQLAKVSPDSNPPTAIVNV